METDLLSTSGYKSNKTGFSLDTNFEYLDDLRLGIGQSSFYERISTNSTASERQKNRKVITGTRSLMLQLIMIKEIKNFKRRMALEVIIQ